MKIQFIGALWCPSCIIMRPRYRRYCDTHAIEFLDLDYDQEEALVASLNLGGTLPVAIVLDHQGQECGRIVGEHRYEDLERRLGVFHL